MYIGRAQCVSCCEAMSWSLWLALVACCPRPLSTSTSPSAASLGDVRGWGNGVCAEIESYFSVCYSNTLFSFMFLFVYLFFFVNFRELGLDLLKSVPNKLLQAQLCARCAASMAEKNDLYKQVDWRRKLVLRACCIF